MEENQLQELYELRDTIITTAKLLGYTVDIYKHTVEISKTPAKIGSSIAIFKIYEYSETNRTMLKSRFKHEGRKTFVTHKEKVDELNRILQAL